MKIKSHWVLLVILGIFSAVLNAQNSRSPEEQAYTAAKGIYHDGLYKLAVDQLTDFLSKYPNSQNVSNASFFLAESYFNLQKY